MENRKSKNNQEEKGKVNQTPRTSQHIYKIFIHLCRYSLPDRPTNIRFIEYMLIG